MPLSVSYAIQRVIRASCQLLHTRFIGWTKPPRHGLVRGLASDLARGKGGLAAENAFLRQQLIVLQRQVKRPALTR